MALLPRGPDNSPFRVLCAAGCLQHPWPPATRCQQHPSLWLKCLQMFLSPSLRGKWPLVENWSRITHLSFDSALSFPPETVSTGREINIHPEWTSSNNNDNNHHNHNHSLHLSGACYALLPCQVVRIYFLTYTLSASQMEELRLGEVR